MSRPLILAAHYEGTLAFEAPPKVGSFDRRVFAGEEPVDLVHHRLVDFALIELPRAAVRQASLDQTAVVTPNRHAHAVFADKRNLTVLSDGALFRAWGASEATISALSILPHAVQVTQANADGLWATRKRLFFKPVSGHGGKAVYRGDKLTRAAWANILASDYTPQDLAPPCDRQIMLDGVATPRKVEVRLYPFAGGPLLAAALL